MLQFDAVWGHSLAERSWKFQCHNVVCFWCQQNFHHKFI